MEGEISCGRKTKGEMTVMLVETACVITVYYSMSCSSVQLLFFPFLISSQSLFFSKLLACPSHLLSTNLLFNHQLCLSTHIQEYKQKKNHWLAHTQISLLLAHVCVTEKPSTVLSAVYEMNRL